MIQAKENFPLIMLHFYNLLAISYFATAIDIQHTLTNELADHVLDKSQTALALQQLLIYSSYVYKFNLRIITLLEQIFPSNVLYYLRSLHVYRSSNFSPDPSNYERRKFQNRNSLICSNDAKSACHVLPNYLTKLLTLH